MRFTVPSNAMDRSKRVLEINNQFDAYLNSDAFQQLLDILKIKERNTIDQILLGLRMYDTRRGKEVQFADTSNKTLRENKEELFDIYNELGLVDVYLPLDNPESDGFSDILILGGSFEACYRRTNKASDFVSATTKRVSGLAAFRPIPTKETPLNKRVFSKDVENPEHTEFEAMSDAFVRKFNLGDIKKEQFSSSTNLNLISNIREFEPKNETRYLIYASPSSSLDRRASTMDTYEYWLKDVKEEIGKERNCRILAVTDNRYVPYQIIPLLICIFASSICDIVETVDIIGCYPPKDQATKDQYDIAYINDIIATVDWIAKFRKALLK